MRTKLIPKQPISILNKLVKSFDITPTIVGRFHNTPTEMKSSRFDFVPVSCKTGFMPRNKYIAFCVETCS
jgi:hypothetical protein